MDANGQILVRERRSTPQIEGYRAILDNIVSLVHDLEARVGRSRRPASRDTRASLRVGIGTPGAISTKTGLLKNSNTVCLNGMPVKQDLERLLAREIRIANDANCFALSEAIDGAGRGYGVVFGVILGTGVGGGIVFHGRLHEGPQHIAGEWGHNVLEPGGPACYCGKRGCVETLLSGPGLVNDYLACGGAAQGRASVPYRDVPMPRAQEAQERPAGGTTPGMEEVEQRREQLPRTPGATGDVSLDARAIVELAATGDVLAESAMQRYLERFGRALSVVVNILDPDAIVLGGGMSNIARLYTEGRAQLARFVFNDQLRTALLPHLHGDSSGVRGAAQLWPQDTSNP